MGHSVCEELKTGSGYVGDWYGVESSRSITQSRGVVGYSPAVYPFNSEHLWSHHRFMSVGFTLRVGRKLIMTILIKVSKL